MAEIVPLHPAPAHHRPRERQLDPLWREAVGDVLRRTRQERGERLADTAGRSGVSMQYLSEIERGLKEPSSEMLAAVAGALDLTLLDLASAVAEGLRPVSSGAVVNAA
ncbi:helix-turn-helix domain-containing protein [Microbacterium elymi]|uniref:Helix-turn-helix domain-containing protein n=1 Tax=Microbacterium elymi TaxID=2909587 RepID=A0ABY5NL35_9MICO|nr:MULTISPECIES: helix-turn-helix transcriptional regulator [Microbacterium]UUT35867.1 helix-turn-helix domain-containing protein [Microbacterium elymi]